MLIFIFLVNLQFNYEKMRKNYLGGGLEAREPEQTGRFCLADKMGLIFSHLVVMVAGLFPMYLRSMAPILILSQGLALLHVKISPSEVVVVPLMFMISTLLILIKEGLSKEHRFHGQYC